MEPTPEALAQEQREAGVINVNYQVLPSADESTVQHVTASASTYRWHRPAPLEQPSSVSALLGALNPGMFGQPGMPPPAPVPAYGYDQQQPQSWQQPQPQHQWQQQPPYGHDPSHGYGAGNAWGDANAQYSFAGSAQHGTQAWNQNDRAGYQPKRGGKKGGKNHRHHDLNGYHEGGRPQDHGWGARELQWSGHGMCTDLQDDEAVRIRNDAARQSIRSEVEKT